MKPLLKLHLMIAGGQSSSSSSPSQLPLSIILSCTQSNIATPSQR